MTPAVAETTIANMEAAATQQSSTTSGVRRWESSSIPAIGLIRIPGSQVANTTRPTSRTEDETYRVVGSPDKISESLELLGRLGLDYLIVHFTSTSAPIGGDIESVVADMEIFAAEVMPNLVGSSGS